jgi:hypothetical protein
VDWESAQLLSTRDRTQHPSEIAQTVADVGV